MTSTDLFWMAPLHGITDHVFRTLYTQHIATLDFAIAPFVSITSGIKEKTERFLDFFPENNKLLPIEPQIMAKKAEQLLLASSKLKEIGYPCFNWNMGCPSNQVTKHGRGAGMLKDIPNMNSILDEFFSKSDANLSVKIRLGFNDTKNLEAIIETLNKYPLKYVCIHPRLASQMYDGTVMLNTFDMVVRELKHTIVYSGDITNNDFFRQLKKRYPQIHNWMIGRGLLSKLNLMHEINPKNPKINIQKFMVFYEEFQKTQIERFKKEEIVVGRLKELWSYFVQNEMIQNIPIQQIKRCQSLKEMDKIISTSIIGE
ncbi:MAG: tRNA-dihydrouridine synthase family protein [Bacteroidales bacterium]|nr:tRNA-dihydrouridine synthase family protein [Bacteroidales bacterium]